MFTSTGTGNTQPVLENMERQVTQEISEKLMTSFTMEEIEIVVMQMNLAKAPGPDGMSPLFYQYFWRNVGSSVTEAVLQALNIGIFPSSLVFAMYSIKCYQNLLQIDSKLFCLRLFLRLKVPSFWSFDNRQCFYCL